MPRNILVLNAGSSSIKFAVFESGYPLRRIAHGTISGLASGLATAFSASDGSGPLPGVLPAGSLSHDSALAWLFDWLDDRGLAAALLGAGHRVVHGGRRHAAPVLIDAEKLADLEKLSPLAPLHQPHNLAPIHALSRLRPGLPQVACFDTAFHRTLPAAEQALALPRGIAGDELRRYGFHGLSYEHVAASLPGILGERGHGRVVAAHLGNGASLCALQGSRSIATTMGFSTLDGLVMGTRCGGIDPGVLLYLMEERRMEPAAVSALLYRQSGLLGVSGISNDMRALLESTDPRAAEAIALFVHRALREAGAMVALLGGLDALAFTGGIGEHAAGVRADICRGLAWLGVELDSEANQRNAPIISSARSRVGVCVIPADEEMVIAGHARRLLVRAGGG